METKLWDHIQAVQIVIIQLKDQLSINVLMMEQYSAQHVPKN